MIHLNYNTRRIQEKALRGYLKLTTTLHIPQCRRGVYAVFYNGYCLGVNTTHDMREALEVREDTVTTNVEVLFRYTTTPVEGVTNQRRLIEAGILRCVLGTEYTPSLRTLRIERTKEEASLYRPLRVERTEAETLRFKDQRATINHT